MDSGRVPGSWYLLLAPAEGGLLSSLCVVPVKGPAVGLSLAVFFQHWSWAACAAMVWCVWTPARPVSLTVRLSTVVSGSAPGLFHVDADTSPFSS